MSRTQAEGRQEPADMWDFFIAHSSVDTSLANEIYDLLAPYARVFLDTRCVRPGDHFDQVISEALRASRTTLVLVSSHSNDAFYQRDEIATAIQMMRNKTRPHRVIPLYVDMAPDDERVPFGLRPINGVALLDYPDLSTAILTLRTLLEATATTLASSIFRLRPRDGTAPSFESHFHSIRIGRSPKSEFHIPDPDVSWHHGVITLHRGSYTYRHRSSNRTTTLRRGGRDRLFKAGEDEECRLDNQDRLTIGRREFDVDFDILNEESGYLTTGEGPEDEGNAQEP